ncbi:691_t:CDS:2, partial [Entrophospora sp. SA101]
FGHATRVVQIASDILSLSRKHTVYIISNAPRFIFQGAIDKGACYRHALIDSGVQQPRAYTVDRQRTIDDLITFIKNRPEMIEKEANWLKEVKADIVLSDAPFLPCAAASTAGIPSAIVSNFTFDAVYNGLCEGDELDITIKKLVEQVIEDYKNSGLLIRLPVIDVPLVVRKSKTPRDIVLKNLGIPEEIFTTHKVLMVSFGGQNLVDIEKWGNPLPDNWIAIVCGGSCDKLPENFYNCPKDAYIPDLTNAADAVMECIGHSKPFIYVPRPQFIEELGLLKLMQFQGISLEMSRERFENGEWRSHILEAYNMSKNTKKRHKPKIEKLKHNGGKVAAEILEKYLDEKYNDDKSNSNSNSVSVFASLKELRNKKRKSTSLTSTKNTNNDDNNKNIIIMSVS